MKTFLLALLVFVAGQHLLTAQSLAQTVALRGFSYEIPAADLHVAAGRKMIPFALGAYEPGATLKLPAGNRTLHFYIPPADPVADVDRTRPTADEGWRPVASVTLPEEGNDFLLGFVPQAPNAQGERWRIQVIENDALTYPPGSMRIINFSPFSLAFEIGGEQVSLKPGERVVKQPEVDQKYRSYLKIAAQMSDHTWSLFHQGVASVLPSRRTTFIVAYSASYLAAIDARDEVALPVARSPRMLVIPWSDQPVL